MSESIPRSRASRPDVTGVPGAKGKRARVAAFTGRRYPLCRRPAAGYAGVSCAGTSLPNVARVLAWHSPHGVQWVERERDRSLQRPAAPEREKWACSRRRPTRAGDYPLRPADRSHRPPPPRHPAYLAVRSRKQPTTRPSPASTAQHHRAHRSGATAEPDLPHTRRAAAQRRGGYGEPSSPSPRWIAARTPCRRWCANTTAGQVPDPGRDLHVQQPSLLSRPTPASLSRAPAVARARGAAGARHGG